MGLVQFEDGKVLYYPYTPSRAAGLTFVVLFAAITIAHTAGMFYFRARFFIPLILGGVCKLKNIFGLSPKYYMLILTLYTTGETFGYYGRAWAGDLPDSPRPFMLQLMLILVSPVLTAATLYMTLGKFKQSILGQPKRRCSPTSIFVITDIIAFCTQIGGGLVQISGNLNLMHIGDSIVLGGLAFQLVVLAIYLGLVLKFYLKACRTAVVPAPWKRYVIMLAVSVVMIWVRNLVKAIEFAQGFHGFVSQNEAMLYIFDGALIFGVMVISAVLHPGQLLRMINRGKSHDFEAMQDYNGEETGPTPEASR